jgi:hypothetical protein
MAFLKFFFGSVGSLVDRVVCVLFAIALAQAPVYIAQYIDVLAGAQMESQKTYDDLEERAAKFDLTLDEFLTRLINNPDPLVKENAEASASTVDRYKRYTEALNALLYGSVWAKPFLLARHYDPSINAAMHFEPNVPLTMEGAVYALAGVLIAMLIMGFFRFIFGKIFGGKKEEKPAGKKTEGKTQPTEF